MTVTITEEEHIKCVASNLKGSVESTCRVFKVDDAEEIEEFGIPPFFVQPLYDDIVDSNNVVLRCVVLGDETTTVTWLENGSPIAARYDWDQFKLIKFRGRKCVFDNGVALLFVEELADFTTEFTCIATNNYGEVNTKAQITKQTSSSSETGYAPKFLLPLKVPLIKKSSNT